MDWLRLWKVRLQEMRVEKKVEMIRMRAPSAIYLITDYIVLGEKQIPYPSEGQKVDTEKIIHSEFYFW